MMASSKKIDWKVGNVIQVYNNNIWELAHIVSISKKHLYVLLEDNRSAKYAISDYGIKIRLYNDNNSRINSEYNDDDDVSSYNDITNQFSTDFRSMKMGNLDDNKSTVSSQINISNIKRPSKISNNNTNYSRMCGYTLWVQWCDSTELHGYYQCIGIKNHHWYFEHRKDNLAICLADKKGIWYLIYNNVTLYKSGGMIYIL